MGKHKHKHKNKSNCHCNDQCHGGCKCQCGDQCKCRDTEHLHIESEGEMILLLNIITKNGQIKEEERQRKVIKLGNDMLADAGITLEELTAPEIKTSSDIESMV